MPNSFLICPVRNRNINTSMKVVDELENEGYTVHFPPRDTCQHDNTGGYKICLDNKRAILAADIVDIIWDGESQGCLFDLGMAFALGKKIRVHILPKISEGKSFQNMIRYWERSQCQKP